MISKNKYSATEENLIFAANKINNGGVIIYPTDTLYSFGVDATNSDAILNLNKIKGRVSPLSIMLTDIKDIRFYAEIDNKTFKEISNILPGPFTVLLKSRNNPKISKYVQSSSDLIGIRIINSCFCNKLIKLINKPIITTSVNLHNMPSLTKINDIENQFNKICFFYSNNLSSKGSTIIDFSRFPRKIIRYGEGPYEEE